MSNESNGMLADFELAVTHLLSACPVASKVAKNSNNAHIYGLGGNFKRATAPRLVWNFDTTRHLSLPISVMTKETSSWNYALPRKSKARK